MFREGLTGRHRHAIGVALRAPAGTYDEAGPEIVVEPAADARLIVRVANLSASAEHLELAVEGMPAGWAEVYPGSVHVPAGEQREADVTVHVPHSAELKAAEWPLRVVAFARGRRVGSAPARVRVAPHAVVCLELRPENLRARRRAHAEVRVRNEGDAPAEVDLTATIAAVTAGGDDSRRAAGSRADRDDSRRAGRDDVRGAGRDDARRAAGPATRDDARRAAAGPSGRDDSRGLAAPPHGAAPALHGESRAGATTSRVLAAPDDPSAALGCSVSPPRVHVGPGEEVVARLEVHGPRRWLRRGDVMAVRIDAGGTCAEATFQQRAALPRWALVVPVVVAAAVAYMSGRPSEVAVPQVTGLTVPEAREKLREAGLKPRQAPLPAEAASESAGVVRQDPPAGASIVDGGAVTISYYRGEGIGTVTPNVASASVAPADGGEEPLAYTRANRVLVLFPGETETSVGGTVGEISTDPAWDPRTGHLAYVRRAAPDADAEIVIVDPHATGTPQMVTEGAGSFVSPAFAPGGGLLAVVSEAEPGAGGSLCVVVPPATMPRCHLDDDWRYYRTAWSDEGLYSLRRKPGTTGQDELMRVGDDLEPTGRPLAQGDLRALAVADDGRLAVLNAGRVEIHAPAGELLGAQTVSADTCDLAWSGDALLISRGACGSTEDIWRLDSANLDGEQTRVLAGGDPAVAR